MNKRILIIIKGFSVGGTISSLASLLSVVDTKKVLVDIFPINNSGNFGRDMQNCNILPENVWLSNRVHEKGILVKYFNLFLLLIRKVSDKLGVDMYRLYNKIGGKQINSIRYDAIIGFDETLSKYVSALPARKRIIWIHCDYRRYAEGKDESRYYDRIDKVVCVSNFAKQVFCNYYPQYAGKIISIHNIINIEELYNKSIAHIDDNRFSNKDFVILSCGRLDPVKQFHLIPSIADKISKITSRRFKWYIIGGGNDAVRTQIEEEIRRYDKSDIVVLLGIKSNPYKYMSKSDLYVCTSWSESYPMVVNEAKALCKPVVCNSFPSASESIVDGVNGFIVDIEQMPDKISLLIDNPMDVPIPENENAQILEQFYGIL